MKRIINAVAAKWQQILALMLTFFFILSAAMTSTAAWEDMSQHKTNIARGEGTPKLSSAILQKYEKDMDGKETIIPVPGAEFALYKVNDDGTANLIASYITGSGGQIFATDLEPGGYYWQETHPANGFLLEIENGEPKKYFFEIPAEDGKPVLSTAYNTRRQGQLALTKTAKNSDGSNLTEEQKGIEFEFTITFSDGKSYGYSIDAGAEQTVASGGQIYLKSGQTAQFNNIPTGIRYEITETPVSGYTITSKNHAGNVTGSGVTAAFTNIYGDIPGDTGNLTVSKNVTGAGADLNKEFSFTVNIGGKIETFTLKHGESKFFENIPYGTEYAVTEHDYTADGYIQSGIVNGFGTVANKNIEAIQSNTYTGPEYINLEGIKSWDLAGAPSGTRLPDSITVMLKNGNGIVKTAVVDNNGGWKYKFEELPKHDALGNEINYTVEEIRIPGWRPIVSGYDIINVYQPPVTCDGIEVEKVITCAALPAAGETFTFILTPVNGTVSSAETPMPDSNEVQITGTGKASFGKMIYTMPGTYTYTITEADGGVRFWNYDMSVYTLTVTVTEDSNGQLKVNKVLTKNNTPVETAIFTNHYDDSGDTVSVRVEKVWEGADSTHPQSVQVQLYRNGAAYGNPVTLSIANSWTRTWSGLDKHSVWTVDEINVPDKYTKSISGDQVSGFVITNTKTPAPSPDYEEITISGKKTWDHGNNPVSKQPDSIAVIIKADSIIAVQRKVTAAENWSWSFQMPKYGEDGKEIVYTVDEAYLNDYVKTVDGYDILNTYRPGNTGNPSPGDSKVEPPKAGDNSNMMLWFIVMLISLAGLIITIVPWKRKWNGKQYVPKY